MTDSIKNIFANGKRWIELEIEYAKLTAAEKTTVLLSTLIFGAVCLLLGIVVLILLAFALENVFESFLSPALSFLCVAGSLLILILLLFFLRKPLLENPISRLISKLILDLKPEEDEQTKS
ncbi:MAG: phage holin family protein [Muribaculaceae bacterium]|nr:phage holin family protein [Muribaculaceae bacterium]